MKGFYFFLVLCFTCLLLHAQPLVKKDSSNISARSFNAATIERFKVDKDFQYNKYKEPVKSIWERFWDWVWFKINQIMSTKSGRRSVYTILIILSVAALAFFLFKVLGMDAGKLFGRKSGAALDYDVTSDNIHDIDFDGAIREAISAGSFRLAVRLLYLQSLKKLSDKELIQWQIDKTNHDYLQEVLSKPWHNVFKQLTDKFEFIWYGEMNIGKEDFEKLQVQFQQFNYQLQ
jgi:hypothetical protein